MRGGSLLKQTLKNGVINIWKLNSIELGGTEEIGICRIQCLTSLNTVDGCPIEVIVPGNMMSAMISAGIIEVYNREGQIT